MLSPEARGLLRRTPSPAPTSTSSLRGPAPFLTPKEKMPFCDSCWWVHKRKRQAKEKHLLGLLCLQERNSDFTGGCGGLTGSFIRLVPPGHGGTDLPFKGLEEKVGTHQIMHTLLNGTPRGFHRTPARPVGGMRAAPASPQCHNQSS